jgi:hypothetical protein
MARKKDPTPPERAKAAKDLPPLERAKAAIDTLLGDGFGIRISPDPLAKLIERNHRKEGALSFSLRVMVLMSVLWLGIPLVYGLYSPGVMTLAIYGVLWSGWSAGTSVLTSRAVSDIVERRILPQLPDSALVELADDIEARFPAWRRRAITWGVGAAAASVSAWLIHGDASLMLIDSRHEVPLWTILVQWWPEWLILFAAAASVVQVSTFYRLLPRHLTPALTSSFRLDPANAALIQAMASVARVILVFWLGIALSVAILLPASTWDWAHAFPAASPPGSMSTFYRQLVGPRHTIPWFVMIEVTVTCSLSLGLGVIVFLFAESGLRSAAREARLATLERIEAAAGVLLANLRTLDEVQLKRLNDLRTLQSSLAAVTPYRSIIYSGLSVLLPFLPLAGLLLKLRG